MCPPKDRHQFTRPVLKGREITKERLEVRGSVQSERSSTLLAPLLNPEPDFRFGSCPMLNFGLDFGPVHRSSGPNRGSGPDCGITTDEHLFASDCHFAFPSIVLNPSSACIRSHPQTHVRTRFRGSCKVRASIGRLVKMHFTSLSFITEGLSRCLSKIPLNQFGA